MDSYLRLEFPNTALGGGQFLTFSGGQPWLEARVDPLLLSPAVNGLLADPQIECDGSDGPPCIQQVQDPPTEFA